MSSETVAVVSSAVVGIAAIVFSWLTARGARIQESTLVREERDQARREGFYVELLSGLTSFAATMWIPRSTSASAVERALSSIPISPPSLEEVHVMITHAWVLGGPDVAELASRFVELWASFGTAEKEGADEDRLKEIRGSIGQVLRELRDAMRRDLHGEE